MSVEAVAAAGIDNADGDSSTEIVVGHIAVAVVAAATVVAFVAAVDAAVTHCLSFVLNVFPPPLLYPCIPQDSLSFALGWGSQRF